MNRAKMILPSKPLRILRLLLAASLLVMFAETTIIATTWDLESDTWVATDALGRSLPGYAECGAPRANRTAGMFYFLWLGQHGTDGPYDITKILASNPTNPAWGAAGTFEHWGEPELGYYLSTDQYVIRKHCQMLVDAGVDVIFLDVTNGYMYDSNWQLLFNTYEQIRSEGGLTPQICFVVWMYSDIVVGHLYDAIYSQNLYHDLWYMWQGKPLILAPSDGLNSTLLNYFTLRRTWAWNAGQDNWTWLDHYPQTAGWHTSGTAEEVSVSVAETPPTNRGRSYHNGAQPATNQYGVCSTTGQGLCFAEQWSRALAVDPQLVFITGWNEWVGQRLIANGGEPFCGKTLSAGKTWFTDTYTQEYSRDIEPMKGGHTDNYYYQTVSNLRRYKGVRSAMVSGLPTTVAIDGNFSAWDEVCPEYRDTIGDTEHRNSTGWGSAGTYVNATGRNDFVKMKVARDNNYIYFYVKTNENITSYTDPNWMLLFIDIDCTDNTGWNGYDFLINAAPVNSTTTTVMRNNGGGWTWNTVGTAQYCIVNDKMEIAIPRSLLGLDGGSDLSDVSFNFHWVDNIEATDITDFSLSGDSAPNRRAKYHYDTVGTTIKSWEFNTNGNVEGWNAANQVANFNVSSGCLSYDTAGDDPYVNVPISGMNASDGRYIETRMKTTDGTVAAVYFGDTNKIGSQAFPIIADGQFHTYYVDMLTTPHWGDDWAGTISALRLDFPNDGAQAHVDIDYVRVRSKLYGAPWEFSISGDSEGWYIGGNIANLNTTNGCLVGDIAAGDPYIVRPRYPDFNADTYRYAHIRMKINAGTSAQIYWETPSEPYCGDTKHVNFQVISDGQFHDYIVDMFSENSLWSGTVNSIRLDPSGDATSGHFEIDYIRFTSDIYPPTGSVVINSGTAYTASTSVNLSFSATDIGVGISKMRFSNDNVNWSTWEAYAASKTWNITSGDGTKTVYVQFADNAANVSSSYSASIILDNTPPAGSIAINSGATYTTSTSVTLTLSATDAGSGVSQMRFYNGTNWSAWEPYAAAKAWTLTSGDGTKTVNVQFKDALGYVSTKSSTIVMDATPPTTPGIPSDAGAYINSNSVTFNWTASSDSRSGINSYLCQIGTTPSANDIFDGDMGNVLSKTITGSYGVFYYCRVQAKDKAGNSSLWSAASNGISVVQNVGIGIAGAKALADPQSVGLSSKTVTAVFGDCFYIEEANRSVGIMIKPAGGIPSGLTIGSLVAVGGPVRTNSDAERWIDATVEMLSY